VFDHFKAMVNTIAGKLRENRSAPSLSDQVGGSTWSFDIWSGHPLEAEVYGTLGRLRTMLVDLRARVDGVNAHSPESTDSTRVVVYAGQYIIGDHDHESEEVL